MKKLLLLVVLVASLGCNAESQSVEGSMDCTVTGNVVVASEEGKFRTYGGIKGDVQVNEKLTLKYQVMKDSFYITLERRDTKKIIMCALPRCI